MKGLYLTSGELNALHGTGPLATSVYVWLRYWMDVKKGVTGLSRPISLAMICDYCETHVPRGAGMQTIKPTIKEVRVALARAERAGVLKRVGNAENLVFKLPLAETLSLDQIKQGKVRAGCEGTEQGTVQGTEQGTEQGTVKANEYEAFEVEQGTEQGTELDANRARNRAGVNGANRAHIRDQSKPYTPQAAYTALEVDAHAVEYAQSEPDAYPPEVAQIAAAMLNRKKSEERALDAEQSQRYGEIYRILREGNAKVSALDRDRMQQWVWQKVTVLQVQAALQLAKRRRAEEGSTQPIGCAYLEAILADIRKPKTPPWWQSVATMDAKARELGIDTARPGESMDQYKARIGALVRKQQAEHEAEQA